MTLKIKSKHPTDFGSYARRGNKQSKRKKPIIANPFLKKRKKRGKFKKVILTIFGIFTGIGLIGTIIAVVFIAGYIGKINANLPDAGKLVNQDMELSTKLYDRNGKLLYVKYGDINREFVPLDKYPKHLIAAVLSTEDKTFYEHKGFDVISMGGALVNYLKNKRLTGASTITQQLARNVVLPKVLGSEEAARQRSAKRKLIEILVSIQLENKLTKDEILELYLNEIPLGGVNYGFQTAAKSYFNKDVKDLTISESAFLAGIIQSPSFYIQDLKTHPNDPDCTAIRRRNAVLDLMLENADKFGLDKGEIEKAKEEPLKLKPAKVDIKAPHFVFYVLSELEKMYSPEIVNSGGLRVKTSLDLNVQKVAEEELKKRIKVAKTWYGVHNGAVVIINPKNGEVLAMVGSVDYNNTKDPRVDGNVNVAIMPRQMGSSVKPYTYLTAFTKGFTPGSPAPDIKFNFGKYKPANWDHKYRGLLSIAEALNQSRNIPAIYTLQTVGGVDAFIATAKKLGITTLTRRQDYGLSITLGAAEMKLLEHTNAFAAFANKGVQYPPTVILEVKDSKGNILYKYKPEEHKERVFSEQEIYLLNWVLCGIGGDHGQLGASMYKLPGQRLCGKTGTTNGPKDLTTIMYYPRLVVGVWAGNNNGKKTYGTRGQAWSSNVPMPIAHNIMKRLVPKYGHETYTRPAGITSIVVCKDTGYIATSNSKCPKISTVAIRSKLPPIDHAHKILPICTLNDKIPSNEAEARAAGAVKDIVFFDYTLPNKAQNKTYLEWISKKYGYKLYSQKPETTYCPIENLPILIKVNSPQDNAVYHIGESINISGTIATQQPIQSVTVHWDNVQIYSGSTASFDLTYQITQDQTLGNHMITITATSSKGASNTRQIPINIEGSLTPTPTPTNTPTPTPSPTPTNTPTPTPSPTPTL